MPLHVDGRRQLKVGYILCVIVVLERATVEPTAAASSSVVKESTERVWSAAVGQPVRRHAFSVTNDLATLTQMLRDESRRRQRHDDDVSVTSTTSAS